MKHKLEEIYETNIVHNSFLDKESITQLMVDSYNLGKLDSNKFSEEEMIKASKYGYEYHQTTSFPEKDFESNCINNFKQWLQSKQHKK
jgi:hypothetical protein